MSDLPVPAPDPGVDKLLNMVVDGHAIDSQICDSYTRSDDQRVVYPLWLAGMTNDGVRFDLMVEFLKPVDDGQLQRLKQALTNTCDEAVIAIKKGVI